MRKKFLTLPVLVLALLTAPYAWAQCVANDGATLSSCVTSVGPNGTITFSSDNITVTGPISGSAAAGLTITGNNTGGFTVGNLAAGYISAYTPGGALPNITAQAAALAAAASSMTSLTSTSAADGRLITLGEGFQYGNLNFHDLNYTFSGPNLVGGAVGMELSLPSGATVTVGDINKTAFQNITAKSSGGAIYGGLVGAYAFSGTNSAMASTGAITDSLFQTVVIQNTTAGGTINGGLIGAYVGPSGASNPAATVGEISSTLFNDIQVTANGEIYGGLAGGFAEHLTSGQAKILTASDNTFNNITVKSTGGIIAGGLVGAAGAAATVHETNGNFFSNINISTTGNYLIVGGVLGAYTTGSTTNQTSEVKSVSGSVFDTITVNSGAGLYGGVIGAFSNSEANLVIGNISSSFFNNIDLSAKNIQGGVISASNTTNPKPSSVGEIINSSFTNIKVKASTDIVNGGVIAAGDFDNTATGTAADIAGITGSAFDTIKVQAHKNLRGGAASAYSLNGVASMGDIGQSRFTNFTLLNDTNGHIYGGVISAYTTSGEANLGAVSNSLFDTLSLNSQDAVFGGAINAYATTGTVKMGAITGSTFSNFTITAVNDIYGGAVSAYASGSHIAQMGDVSQSAFTNIQSASSVGNAYGGAIFSSGLKSAITITDTLFKDNAITAADNAYGGAIFIDTRLANSGTDHQLTLAASAGGLTEFKGNTNNGINTSAVALANSIHFGLTGGTSQENAALNINAAQGGTVALYDPVSANMDNGKTFTLNTVGAGDFLWGGLNELGAAGGNNVNLTSGRTVLLSDYQLTKTAGALNVALDGGGTLAVVLENRPTGNALPMFVNPDSFTVTGGPVKIQALSAALASFLPAATEEWMITDNRWAVDETNFDTSLNPYDIVIETRGAAELWITASNQTVIQNLNNHPNPNVIRDLNASALAQAWETAKTQATLAGNDLAITDIFGAIAQNPELTIAEAALSVDFSALNFAEAGSRQAIRLDRASGEKQRAGLGQASAGDNGQRPWRLWAGYVGQHLNQKDSGGYYGYKSNYHGAVMGGAHDFSEGLTAALYFSAAKGKSEFSRLSSEIKTDAAQGGLFLTVVPMDNLNLTFDAAFGHFGNDLTRHTPFGRYEADFGQNIFGLGLGVSYDLAYAESGLTLSPFLDLRYQHIKQNGFTENGPIPALANQVAPHQADSFATTLGLDAKHEYVLENGNTWAHTIKVGWRHEFADTAFTADSRYLGSPLTYSLQSVPVKRDSVEIDLGVNLELVNGPDFTLSLDGGYGLSLAKERTSQNWQAGLNLEF